MRTLKIIMISGSVGALLAVLVTINLTSGLGTLLTAVAQLLGQQPEPIRESPTTIIQWYHQFADEAEGQVAAQEKYYDRYVEWELTIDQLEPVGAYVQTISEYPGSPSGSPPHAVWAFFSDRADIKRLHEDQPVVVHGKIVFINAGNIFLGNCDPLSSGEG